MAAEQRDYAELLARLYARRRHGVRLELDRMRAVTGGESVRANVALLRHNAGVAAALAVAGI